LPEFLVRETLADGRLQIVLPQWQLPAAAMYWVSPPGGPRPRRVTVLADFFAARLGTRRGEQGSSV
jgi:DNA-binding transcriptional LysR family regulator